MRSDRVLRQSAACWSSRLDSRTADLARLPSFPTPWISAVAPCAAGSGPANNLPATWCELNLDKMARGGIYDHLGGGFARYSVDERWLVPHFEKMLYDNALLAGVYLRRLPRHRRTPYARVARETLDYILRDMTDAGGGFHSTEDADSEGEEGKFYVWTPAEIREVLAAEQAGTVLLRLRRDRERQFRRPQYPQPPKTIEQCAAPRRWDPQELERRSGTVPSATAGRSRRAGATRAKTTRCWSAGTA